MKRVLLLCVLLFLFITNNIAQSGTEFWLAPPDVTELHNSPGGVPIYLNISTFSKAATVTIDQPANPSFTPIVINLAANTAHQENLSSFVSVLETRPTNTVLNTGLRVSSTEIITAYYEVSNTSNPDIFALKGKNALGDEFYIPLHNHAPFYNHTFASPHPAFASFEIVATEDSTDVTIFSPVPVDGHPARTPFTIRLDRGQTYSCAYTGTNYENPINHPSGAIVLSNKDIAISIKDDSNHNPSGGCYDLLGDQIVPVGIVGTEYIAIKGRLNSNGDESVFILATENNTKVYIDGSSTPIVTLFAGQTYRYDMDYLASSTNSNSVYITLSKPSYVTHVTGFGCEMGTAILPPLNCAGSEQVAFTRSTSEGFFLNILVRSKAVGGFSINGSGTATIDTTKFIDVPGTGGEWKAAQLEFNASQIPVNTAQLITNSKDVFALGIINGGAGSGCRYGFFSEFAAEVEVVAGSNGTVCANDTFNLSGSVSGGTTTGEWTTTGSGQFIPSETDLNARYVPSPADISAGSVIITLTSTGNCTPVADDFRLNIIPAPTVSAGANVSVCANNSTVALNGSTTIASGGIWTGGSGTFSPNNVSLITNYTPSASEIASGTVTLTLTTTGNGTCHPVTDNITISITPAPIVDAGPDQNLCANNSIATLSGSVLGASAGVWSGGAGSFSPNSNSLNATYTPTANEIALGSVVLTLTTVGNGNCLAETDSVTLNFTPAPTVSAGANQILCRNNSTANLNGSVSVAGGAQWSGGAGVFYPNSNTLNATYTPTSIELATGFVELTLTTTNNGLCNAVMDTVRIDYTPEPLVNAGNDTTVCAINPIINLSGQIGIATGGVWVGGNGTFSSSRTTLINTYSPTSSEIANGSLILTLESTGNGNCSVERDSILISFQPQAIVNAGANQTSCANNPQVNLAGIISNATGGVWSGGTGSFSTNNADLNAIYTPSISEINAGGTTLYLTSTGNGNCTAVVDSMRIIINASPTANAGPNQTICSNNPGVSIYGSVNGASGGQWHGGLGTFSPSANALNVVYTPTATEIANGSIDLILTTTGNVLCNPVHDTMTINFTPSPVVSAGNNDTVCANNPIAQLQGSVLIASGGIWSGGGTFSPSDTSLNAQYTPSAAEINAGRSMLYLRSTGNGNCNPVVDSVVIYIPAAPTVDAGQNRSVCVDNMNVVLSGSVSGITNTGQWSTTGTGVFVPSNNVLNATYIPSSADSIAGQVGLILSSTNNRSCMAVTDTMFINIAPAGIADAGSNVTVCGNNANVRLSGSVSGGATAGTWSTSGTGTFSPNNTFLSATYIPSENDILNGSVTLTLTSNSCDNSADKMEITITPAPIVDAGNDQIICADSLSVSLMGVVTGASTTGKWSTTGSGTFIPNDSALTVTYIPSTTDSILQEIELILTSTNIGNCNIVSDTMNLSIYPTGTVDAGKDQVLCANNSAVSLNGVIGGGADKGKWSTSGSGHFIPSNTDLNATYIPSSADSIIGGVQLKLLATNSCNQAADSINISFTTPPVVDAGPPSIAICGTNPNLPLSGKVNGAVGGEWSTSGTGTFSPSNTNLNAIYQASAADINRGSITLYLTSTGNDKCNAVVDSIEVNVGSGIVADAGVNQQVCATSPYTQLRGKVSNGTTTGVWKTLGSGTFSPSDSLLTAEYHFSSADTLNGSVRLVLTSTNNGSCAAATDTIEITFGDAAFVYAGIDQMTCTSNPDLHLDGMVTGGATKGTWITTGTGVFTPSDSALDAVYIPSNVDVSNGELSLILRTTNHGSCKQGSDTLQFKIEKEAIVDAGVDIEICAFVDSIPLSGSIQNAKGSRWTTKGTGRFIPSDTLLNAYYQPSASDLAGGEITLFLTSRGGIVCSNIQDSIRVQLVTPLAVDFTFDESCVGQLMSFKDRTTVNNGIITNWEWDFDGKISNSQNPIHIFTSPGTHDVKLTVTSSLGCKSSIIKTVFINDAPYASFDIRPDTADVGNEVSFLDASSGASSWNWDFGDGIGNSTEQSPRYAYPLEGIYHVKLVVANALGCTDTIVKSVIVIRDAEDLPLLPNAFSPNKDDLNDEFKVLGGPFKSVEFKVYNNWGNLIFESKDENKGWDGTWKGEPQEAGDYVYTLRIITLNGEIIKKYGSVALIR